MKKKRKTRSDKLIARMKDKNIKETCIKTYGIDGEKLGKTRRDKVKKKVHKDRVRIFCKECVKFSECQGKNWDSCEFRGDLLKIVKK